MGSHPTQNVLPLKHHSVSLFFLGDQMLVDPTLDFWEHDKHPLHESSSEFSFFDYIPIDVKFSSEPIRHKETIMLVSSKKHDIQKAEGFRLS